MNFPICLSKYAFINSFLCYAHLPINQSFMNICFLWIYEKCYAYFRFIELALYTLTHKQNNIRLFGHIQCLLLMVKQQTARFS